MADSLQLKVVLDLVDKAGAKLRNIAQGSKGAGNSLRELQTRLKQLESQQKSIGQHRELETRLAGTSQQLVQQRRELKSLQAAYQSAETPTAKMTAQLRMQAEAVGKLIRAENSQQAELQQSRAALSGAGIATEKLAIHESRLAREISQANAKIDQQKTRLANLAAAQRRAQSMHSGGMTVAAHGSRFCRAILAELRE